jgi:hypothetical protein
VCCMTGETTATAEARIKETSQRLRIGVGRDAGGEIVTVDGRLDSEGVWELERVVAALSGPVRLELGGLRSVAEAGREALRALRAHGIAVTGASRVFASSWG